jgi:two-component system, NarL family, sensor kinase
MKLWVWILALLSLAHSSNAQHLSDSILKQYQKPFDSNAYRAILKVAASIQNKDYPNCKRLCDTVAKSASENRQLYFQAEAFFLNGLTHYFAGEYEQTLNYYQNAIKLFEQSGQLKGKAKVLNELGIFYNRQGDPKAAFACYSEAFDIATAQREFGIMATAINNKGLLAQNEGKHDSALAYFTRARDIYATTNDQIGISYTLDYSSVSFAAKGDIVNAIRVQQQSYEIRMDQKDSNAAALSLINLAEFELKRFSLEAAKAYAQRCIDICHKIGYKDLTADSYRLLSNIAFQKGDNRNAYRYLKTYDSLNTELFNSKRSKQINILKTRFETEQKAQQIVLLSTKNQLIETRQKQQRLLFTAFIILLTSGFIAYYHFYKRKQQSAANKLILLEKEKRQKAIIEAEEKERLRIARDLHDGVAQTMVAAKMQLESFTEKQGHNISDNLQHALELVTQAANEVRSISHSMVPNALLKSGLVAAIRDFVHRIGSDKLKINLEISGLKTRLDENLESAIFRALQELVNNVIKHADASEISIQLIHEPNELTLILHDNGVGFDTLKLDIQQGIGLQNIQSRVEAFHGSLHIDSSPGRGTTVIIDLPVKTVL